MRNTKSPTGVRRRDAQAVRARTPGSTQQGASAPPSRRRRALVALAVTGAAFAVERARSQPATAGPRPACVLTPAQTEGPYFVDERLERVDIRSDPSDGTVRTGVPLVLDLHVSALADGLCTPLRNAIVDVWHCDASGVYSDTGEARGTKFLRGFQRTDSRGAVRFVSIYPGAYPGRAVHIHFKIRAQRGARDLEFTSQLYFDDALTDRVHADPAYAKSRAPRTRNASDGIYRRGGRELTLDVVRDGEGYAAAYEVGVQA
jgi:protocatechuate 3,4-dioxygenase beta subunit